MRIVSFNVNGIRAIRKKGKGALDHPFVTNADVVCLQELRCDDKCALAQLRDQFQVTHPFIYCNPSSTRKGYSGTAIVSRVIPLNVVMPVVANNDEGRIICAEFNSFILVNVYTPNSGKSRLEYRTHTWDVEFRKCICELELKKPVVVCGDLNVAHQPIDVYNPSPRTALHAGFTLQERIQFGTLLKECKLVDVFRKRNPSSKKYTWWSDRAGNNTKQRRETHGWRIDYFLVSQRFLSKVELCDIEKDVYGSDHAPIFITLDL